MSANSPSNENTLFSLTKPLTLFLIVTIPGIISMLMSSLYQTIDGICVGKVLGEEAFAAVNLVMPLVILNFSISDLIGVGSAVPIAIKLGEKKEHEARSIFTSACILIVASGIIIGAVLFIFGEDFLLMMKADGKITALAVQYLRVAAVFSPVTTMLFAVDNFLRICGKIRYSMFVNILMSVLCIVFEVALLFVMRLGVWAAAFAFSASMAICVIVAFIPFLSGKLALRFVKPNFSFSIISQIVSNGMPTFLFNIAGRITSIIMNFYLLYFGGATAVSAYGVLMYADGIIQPVLYGLCDSLQPAIGYNYGAKQFGRIRSLEKICFGVCAALSGIMMAISLVWRKGIVSLFSESENSALLELACRAMIFFATAYVVRWFCLAVQSYMTAIGKVKYATLISVCAAFIFPVILIFALLPMGLDGLWLNMPLASLLTAVVSAFILIKARSELKREELESNAS